MRDQRVVLMMSKEELRALDDWRFANRLGSRAKAIRILCEMAMKQETPDA